MKTTNNILGLDVGSVRVGVAVCRDGLTIPHPLTTLLREADFWDKLQALIIEHDIQELVVGMPRNLEGERTEQSVITEDFISNLKKRIGKPVHTVDEALTSVRAREILDQSGGHYKKEAVDAVAASLILSDYVNMSKDM